jgi:hypothetical protein
MRTASANRGRERMQKFLQYGYGSRQICHHICGRRRWLVDKGWFNSTWGLDSWHGVIWPKYCFETALYLLIIRYLHANVGRCCGRSWAISIRLTESWTQRPTAVDRLVRYREPERRPFTDRANRLRDAGRSSQTALKCRLGSPCTHPTCSQLPISCFEPKWA